MQRIIGFQVGTLYKLEYARSRGLDISLPVGLDVIVDGTVPVGNNLHLVTFN